MYDYNLQQNPISQTFSAILDNTSNNHNAAGMTHECETDSKSYGDDFIMRVTDGLKKQKKQI